MWSATFGTHIWQGEKAIYHYHIWKIEPIKGLADKSFLFHKLNEITESLKQKSTNGGTMLHITKSFMEGNKIMFPPVEEQTAIATILSDMDAQINALENKREKTRQLKQGMMQALLTGRIQLG
jgi:type I restriction enzyme S subunit